MTVNQKINVRYDALQSSIVNGKTFLCQDMDGTYFYTFAQSLPELQFRRIVAQYKMGKAVNKLS